MAPEGRGQLGLGSRAVLEAERGRPAFVEIYGAAVNDKYRRWVPGAGVGNNGFGRVVLGVPERRVLRTGDRRAGLIEGLEHLGGTGSARGHVPQQLLQAAHRYRRDHVMAYDIADAESDPPGGQLKHVIPVPAHVTAVVGRAVADPDPGSGQLGRDLRQKGLLQLMSDGVLILVLPRPAQRLPS